MDRQEHLRRIEDGAEVWGGVGRPTEFLHPHENVRRRNRIWSEATAGSLRGTPLNEKKGARRARERQAERYINGKRLQIIVDAMKSRRFLSFSCPRRDSNPHIFKGQWILSPSRLPFRHSGWVRGRGLGRWKRLSGPVLRDGAKVWIFPRLSNKFLILSF